jgi:hypothetical protein
MRSGDFAEEFPSLLQTGAKLMHETQRRQSRQALAGSGAIQRLVIFTLVDEVAVAMDACGAHT